MNDNYLFSCPSEASPSEIRKLQTRQLAAGKKLAQTAIVNPETMRTDDIQEIGWALLVVLKRLNELNRGVFWDAS